MGGVCEHSADRGMRSSFFSLRPATEDNHDADSTLEIVITLRSCGKTDGE